MLDFLKRWNWRSLIRCPCKRCLRRTLHFEMAYKTGEAAMFGMRAKHRRFEARARSDWWDKLQLVHGWLAPKLLSSTSFLLESFIAHILCLITPQNKAFTEKPVIGIVLAYLVALRCTMTFAASRVCARTLRSSLWPLAESGALLALAFVSTCSIAA